MSHVCNVGVVCSKFYTQREPCPEQEWARLEHASKNKSGTLGFCCHTSFCQKFSNFVFCDDFRIDMFLITWEASNSHQQSFQEATRLESLDLGDLGQELCICIDFRMYYVYVVCICIMYVYIYIYIMCMYYVSGSRFPALPQDVVNWARGQRSRISPRPLKINTSGALSFEVCSSNKVFITQLLHS